VILSLTFEQWILGFSLVMPRLLVAFGLLPYFSSQMIPGMLRMGVAASLCIVLVPPVGLGIGERASDPAWLFVTIFKEVILGLLIGFTLASLYWAAESIGSYIDNQRGSAMASSANPLTSAEATPLGILFTQAFTVYVMTTGAFLLLLGAFYNTYVLWPVLDFLPSLGSAGPAIILDTFSRMVRMIVVLSAPLIVAMFLAEFALALVSRFAPQINVFFLAMPIKSALAIFMLIFYGPILYGGLLTFDGGFEGAWRVVEELLK
jgi:type III secretion protein T